MFTITKEFHFSAAHVLTYLKQGHPCSRMHGHNYIVKVKLSAQVLNTQSFVKDYGDLKPIKDWIDHNLDHKFIAVSKEQVNKYNLPMTEYFLLNRQSSAESLAEYIFNEFKEQFPALTAIGISETPKTWAWYNSPTIKLSSLELPDFS